MTEFSVMTVLATIDGKPLTEMPSDLFIPPDALAILLDSFTGPLDLLLYLIRQQDIDILNIPMAMITQQYMQYIELLEAHRMALAADYLVMAAVLAEIKSRLLLPVVSVSSDEPEVDPRMELVRRLQAYELLKKAAMALDALSRCNRDVFPVKVCVHYGVIEKRQPDVELSALVAVMSDLMQRQDRILHHQITKEGLSVRERMLSILQHLKPGQLMVWTQFLSAPEGRMGLVVTLLAILELTKQSLVTLTQTAAYAPLYLQVYSPHDTQVGDAHVG